MTKKNQEFFFELIRAGLWGAGNPEVRIDETTDWIYMYRLAQEQSVQGLVLQGVEWFKNHNDSLNIPQFLLLQWIGEVQVIEQRNKEMNVFIADLIQKLRNNNIYTILVKGQGLAQCYDRPLWRSAGDIDFYLSEDNFKNAKSFFRPLVGRFNPDNDDAKNIGFKYGKWDIELHDNQDTRLSKKIDNALRDIHNDLFCRGNVRHCEISNIQVFLPSPNNDILIVFTHFLKHFYKGGLGLRQICDWCRLLWTYRAEIDCNLLEQRLEKMGLISEWLAFARYAVEWLGIPADAMPLYSKDDKWGKKAYRINSFVMEVGNMGQNRNNLFYDKKSFVVRKVYSFCRRINDAFRHISIFPLDSFRFMPSILLNGIKLASKGIG